MKAAESSAANGSCLSRNRSTPFANVTDWRANLADIRPISDGTGLNEAFARLKAASETPIPQAAAQARLEEVLAWLAEAGCVFAAHSEPDLTHRVRKMIAADTAKNWQENDMAAQFSMSVATFRRHLAQKNTGFRRLLADVRMMRALTLLQVSGKPVSQIAYEVGYQSPSRFTARFKERFGVLPSEVRSDGTIQSESGKSPFYSELK
ncbi:hypothetical protein BG910_10840 [Neisseria chenwenguii]|uniref:HTH araC/xylS-type domain-containing protein n=1 Tax=Neisseria chenwenguii TaxID=1853278 RepID=A0A220S417_9NEIS|nr:hypothetical protein BG910_10840 [Neisseria chenwenguii]